MDATEDAQLRADGVSFTTADTDFLRAVDVDTTELLVALLTDENLDRLALAPDDPVGASFKATATRARSTE